LARTHEGEMRGIGASPASIERARQIADASPRPASGA
jgi:hypothetical protein